MNASSEGPSREAFSPREESSQPPVAAAPAAAMENPGNSANSSWEKPADNNRGEWNTPASPAPRHEEDDGGHGNTKEPAGLVQIETHNEPGNEHK